MVQELTFVEGVGLPHDRGRLARVGWLRTEAFYTVFLIDTVQAIARLRFRFSSF